MKKAFAIMLVAAVVGTSAFALDLSAGIGGLFTADFTTYSSKDTDVVPESQIKTMQSTLLGGGVNLFFDATYVEVNLGLVFGGTRPNDNDAFKLQNEKTLDTTALRIGLLGKYPIAFTDKFTFFPLLGIDYELVLDAKQDGKEPVDQSGEKIKPADLSALWFKLGVGGDIALTDSLYLRPEFLYGIRLNTKSETDLLDQDMGSSSDKISKYVGILGHGLDVKLSVGYRF